MVDSPLTASRDGTSGRLVRHRLADRLFHWVMAVAVLLLLATGFLPKDEIYGYPFDWDILGYRLNWVPIHWVTGLVLTIAVLFHIVRASIWLRLAAIIPGPRDIADAWRTFRRTVADRFAPPVRQGKYSMAQKLYHLAITAIVLTLIVTGLLMLAKIDTTFWQRNPYFLSSYSWGIVYVLHGYASMLLLAVLILHVYFALRPEKLFFTRSMIVGWITGEEYRKTFDDRWHPEPRGTAGRPEAAEHPAE
jgi:cytochrome b subunit of formate dehydrogenase